jgi:hypothetical protein
MVFLLDLNNPIESVDALLRDDAPLDALMMIAASRSAPATTSKPAPASAIADDPPDDDAHITWEDAEWQ